MIFYVVGGDGHIDEKNVNEETLRRCFHRSNEFCGFKAIAEAINCSKSLSTNPFTNSVSDPYPVFEVEIEGSEGITAAEDGTNSFDIVLAKVKKLKVISATLNDKTYPLAITVDNSPAQVTPISSSPIEPTPAQQAPRTPNPHAQTFLNKYGNALLFGCAYLLTTVALTVGTSLSFVIAAGIAAVVFGLGKVVYPYAKSAWKRWSMTDRQRYEADLLAARTQLAHLEALLFGRSDADNQFIASMHQLENNAPDAIFDAQGKAIQSSNPNTKAVVMKFEIEAMRNLTAVSAHHRPQAEDAILQVGRVKFSRTARN